MKVNVLLPQNRLKQVSLEFKLHRLCENGCSHGIQRVRISAGTGFLGFGTAGRFEATIAFGARGIRFYEKNERGGLKPGTVPRFSRPRPRP
jgi:hypothetical protein